MKTDLPYLFRRFIIPLPLFIISLSLFAQTRTRVTGAANWNTNSTWVKPMSGGVTCLLISKTVLGLGTSFLTELSPGDVLTTVSGQQIGTVATISSSTSLQLVSNASILLTLFTSYGAEKVPGPGDDVEIGNTAVGGGVTVTLNTASATINSLTFIADNVSNTLTHASTNSLTVTNGVTIQQPTSNSNAMTWNINAGIATAGDVISFSGVNTTSSRVGKINITSGTLNANNGITFSGSTAATKVIDMSGGAGSLNLKGALTVPASSATLTAGTSGSIFNYTDASPQTINYFPSGKYYNLYINNTSVSGATLSAAITTSNVDGNISVGNNNSGSTFKTGNYAVALNNSRNVTIASGSTLNSGTSVISFGTGTPNLTINGSFITANTTGFSGLTTTSINSTHPPTFALGSSSTIEYNSASNQTVTGRTDYANIAVSGGAIKTADGDITANNDLEIRSGTTLNGSSFTHYMRGTVSGAGSFTASTCTMVFSGTGAQTIPPYTYNNLETSTGGTKTPSGNVTVSGDFTIGSGTTFAASSYTHSLAGDFVNNGTFTAGSSTINFNGSANQQISGITQFNNITVNNANELSIANAITVHGDLTLTNGRFNINGKTLTLDGTFSGNSSNSLKGSLTSNLTISNGFSGGTLYFDQTSATYNNYVKNFKVNNSASIDNNLNIAAGAAPGTVAIANGATLTTNDYLTIKSDASGTARIDELPVDGSGAATAYISGKAIIERYIPAAKGWRLLSPAVQASGAPTINEAWQEGLTTASANPNLYPGYGVKICGGSSTNGYDTSATINTFIKTYNNATNNFVALPSSPGTLIPITSYPAYFLYIRGDRSVDMLQGLGAAITSTTLRIKGQPITGKKNVTVNSTGFTVLGNPYASAIDFHTLSKSNVTDAFYVWDPKLAGNYGIGGYVTLSWNNATHVYDATGSVSAVSQYVQSGDAVLISSADNTNPGTISINESDKTSGGSDQVYRSGSTDQKLRVNLYLAINDSISSLLDGVLTTYDDANSNLVDNNDAKKLYGSNQSINLRRDGKNLAIERRQTITSADTVFLNQYQMKIQNYKLEIIAENMDNTGMQAILKDKYSNTTNNWPLLMNDSTTISFTVTNDPASYAFDRFSIVFEPLAPVPVSFKKLNAYAVEKTVAVEWQTENETITRTYEVERSADSRTFTRINNNTIAASTGTGNYIFKDIKPVDGWNYYRIASIQANGQKNYSSMVKVNMSTVNDQPAIAVYPNPVTGNAINIKFNNVAAAFYTLEIFNMSGQLVLSRTIYHSEGSVSETVQVNDNIPAGKYEIKLTGNNTSLLTQLLKK